MSKESLFPDRRIHRTGLRRRDFLAGALGGGASLLYGPSAWAENVPLHCVPPLPSATPVPFTPPTTGPVRVRKSVFELDDTDKKKLKDAYAALRKLTKEKPNDPRGWHHQGLIHCWYCSGASDAVTGMEIHGGWWFLPWHRAYLYFHETILGHLIGDASFAVPYWDWDTPGRNRFPDNYRTPNDASNPLFDPTRKEGPTDKIPDFLVGKKVMDGVLGATTYADFGGSSDQSLGQKQSGRLEGAPHGGVHLWTTDPKVDPQNPKTNMGVLATAALDPVFFSHHANIDRLWDKWLKTPANPGSPPHANPTNGPPQDDPWLNQAFFFYDRTPTWTYIQISQVTDHEGSLRYRYQPPNTGGGGGNVAAAPAAPAPAAAAAPAVAQAEPPGPPIVELTPTPGPKALTPDPSTIQVPVPQPARDTINALAAAAPASPKRLTLHIDGVELPADRGAVIKVYLNQPNATAASSADDPGFVGTIVVVPSITGGAHGHGNVVRNFTFDVTDNLKAAPGNENIAVTLVPATGDGQKPAAVSVKYQRVYVTSR